MSALRAPTLPEAAIRARARNGTAEAFPPSESYGGELFGGSAGVDLLDAARLVPPIFMPLRLEKLVELGREPTHHDVDLTTHIGGFAATLPIYLSAFGSTEAATGDLALAVSRQAGLLGIPMVIGENVVSTNGYGRLDPANEKTMLGRIQAYAEAGDDRHGGVVVQQSTQDADAEVWNLVYSDPTTQPLLESGRLGFELKVGQGAKPGLGGMTLLDRADAERLGDRFVTEEIFGHQAERSLRTCSPGTFTEEILRQQIRLMRNNFPRAKVWVKLHPGRDVDHATAVAWSAGADAVTVDGAEAGSGWAPVAPLEQAGLPLGECLLRIGRSESCLLVSGRTWEGGRVVKCLALGATAAGLGRAALIAADEDAGQGVVSLVTAMALELKLLISSFGKYSIGQLAEDDVWFPGGRP